MILHTVFISSFLQVKAEITDFMKVRYSTFACNIGAPIVTFAIYHVILSHFLSEHQNEPLIMGCPHKTVTCTFCLTNYFLNESPI